MSLSRAVFWLSFCFVGGVFLGSFVDMSQRFALAFLVAGIFLMVVFLRQKTIVFIGAAVIVCTLGVARYNSEELSVLSLGESVFDVNQEVMFLARVVKDPDIRANNMQLVLKSLALPRQKVLVNVDRLFGYEYGDMLKVSGRLQVPIVFDEFDYKTYLAQQGISFVMYQPEIELVERGSYEGISSSAYAVVLKLKHTFREVLHEHIPPPQSTILGAILLGDKSAMQDETKEKLNASGLRHITAISGMHVGLLTILLMRLFIWIGLWRFQAFYVTVAFMILFIVLTGLQPSAMRAGIMGGMFLLGQHLGRINVSMRALVFAAIIMLGMNPLLLGNVGFQLSFLAVLGIILFLPIFQHLSRGIPKKLQDVRDIMAMTIAAQILTLPILIFNFGYVSLVSLVTNVLVVPILPFLLAFGFMFLIGGSLVGLLGLVLSLPVFFLLSYLTFIVDYSSQLPFATVQVENLSVFWLALLYIPIAFFYWKFRKRQEFPGFY